MVLGSLPPIAFLLLTQWAMYGHPFWPGQHWMPNQNVYVNVGARGFTFVDPELFLQNLFHPGFGLFVWGPIFALAFVPAWRYPSGSLILPLRERRFVFIVTIVLMLFCATNQYARLQWNSGFRYLMPLVPFLFLALSDHWVRMPAWLRVPIATVTVVQCWVLTAFREQTPRAWREFFAEGPQLPWYRVLGMTSNPDNPWLGTWWIPTLLLIVTLAIVAAIWTYGSRLETSTRTRLALQPDSPRIT
jgi:hypothetical protein